MQVVDVASYHNLSEVEAIAGFAVAWQIPSPDNEKNRVISKERLI